MTLQGKSAILFGAGAIAEGYATLLAQEGVNLAIVSRGQSAQDLAQKIQGQKEAQVFSLSADASDSEHVHRAYQEAIHRLGQIDIVINGSGGNSPDASATSLEDFLNMPAAGPQKMLDNNYTSKWYSIQAYMAHLKDKGHRGSVVNITSMAGLQPLSRGIHYSAAYAAVENLTKSMAYVFGHFKLGRINNLAVGFTIGDQNRKLLLNDDGTLTPRGEEIISSTSQHRYLSPEDIAPHVVYLADSEKTEAINGITLQVDGGFGLIGLHQTGYKAN